MAFIHAFDDHHLKHARQAYYRGRRQKDQPAPAPRLQRPIRVVGRVGKICDLVQHRGNPARQPPDHKDAHCQQRHQFYHRLYRDGRDNAVVLFFGIQRAGAEQNGERRQPHRHPKGGCIAVGQRPAGWGIRGKHPERQADRLQLQRDIGGRGDNGDQRDHHPQQVRFAEPG